LTATMTSPAWRPRDSPKDWKLTWKQKNNHFVVLNIILSKMFN
jgi:hypothetical protein